MSRQEHDNFDCIILGAGIAGACLALELGSLGLKLALIDSMPSAGASYVASAMMHPYGLGKVRDQAALQILFSEAINWYNQHCPNALLSQNFIINVEQTWLCKAGQRLDMQAILRQVKQVAHYHAAIDARYQRQGNFWHCAGLRAPILVLCTGYAAKDDPNLSFIKWKAARGSYQHFKTDRAIAEGFAKKASPLEAHQNGQVLASNVLACGVYDTHFLLPEDLDGVLWRFGADYQWQLDPDSRQKADEDIRMKEKFEALINKLLGKEGLKDWQYQTSVCAIRPICNDRNPVIGSIQDQEGLFILNGLGARGFMHAPNCASQLAKLITRNTTVSSAWDVMRFY